MVRIAIDFGMISVTIDSDSTYPDIMDDMTRRANAIIRESATTALSHGWCPFDFEDATPSADGSES